MKFWLGIVSKEHVMKGVSEGFAQVCHGKGSPLKRMRQGDGFIFYSPTITFGGKDKLQAFTAIGIVKTGIVYQFEMSPDFIPFRIDIDYLVCKEVPINNLKNELNITQGSYGMLFRRGHIEISEHDFYKIASSMEVSLEDKFADNKF